MSWTRMNFGKYDVQRPKNERKGVVLPERFREKPELADYKCWGCGTEVRADTSTRPRCPTPKCGILMDRKEPKR